LPSTTEAKELRFVRDWIAVNEIRLLGFAFTCLSQYGHLVDLFQFAQTFNSRRVTLFLGPDSPESSASFESNGIPG